LENTWREIDYWLNVLRATKGAHSEVHWCVVKRLLELHLKKVCLYSTYSSFLVINVCNQWKTLCSPCLIQDARSTKQTLVPQLLGYVLWQTAQTPVLRCTGSDITYIYPFIQEFGKAFGRINQQ
jgi:hypothetical protein